MTVRLLGGESVDHNYCHCQQCIQQLITFVNSIITIMIIIPIVIPWSWTAPTSSQPTASPPSGVSDVGSHVGLSTWH